MSRTEKDLRVMTPCICPKCRKIHKKKIFWTGNGDPRYFCHECRYHTIVAEYFNQEPCKTNLKVIEAA